MSPFEGAATGRQARALRIEASRNFVDGRFRNPVPTRKIVSGALVNTVTRQLFGKEQRVPAKPLPIVSLTGRSFVKKPASGMRVTWLGHATTIVEIEGHTLLLDPVWSERVSPVQFFGPKRFHPPPLPLDELPPLDAIIISHNHYDHLDRTVIRAIGRMGVPFVTALGVGAHLEKFGVLPGHITELDWNQSTVVGDLKVTATPARHFSGRGIFDGDRTLWASWVIAGPQQRIFFTGDTGYFDEIAHIGRDHGPFGMTLIKIGAYGDTWPDIHLTPEDAVRLHEAVRGELMLPIHWGTFNLAFHAWNEPPERLLAAARAAGVKLVVPRPGEQIDAAAPAAVDPWWRL
jgi:L-ascorbate metabolism protein UlaG (beta-lactamase superfamily)